jgi:hypothetical protein
LRSELAGVHECHILIQRATISLADAFEALELATIEILFIEFARDCLIGRAFLADAAERRVRAAAFSFHAEE